MTRGDNETKALQEANGRSESDRDTAPPRSVKDDKRDFLSQAEELNEVRFEDLTLAELFGWFLRSPIATWRRTRRALAGGNSTLVTKNPDGDTLGVDPAQREAKGPILTRATGQLFQAQTLQLLFFTSAFVCALLGTSALLGPPGISRTAENTLDIGAPFLWLAFTIWLIGEAVGHNEQLRTWWRQLSRLGRIHWLARGIPLAIWLTCLQAVSESMVVPKEQSFEFLLIAAGQLIAGLILWHLLDFLVRRLKSRFHATATDVENANLGQPIDLPSPQTSFLPMRDHISNRRIGLALLSMLASAVLWMNTGGNRIEPPFIVLWIVSSLSWAMVFAPTNWNVFDWLTARVDRLRRVDWRENRWFIVAFVLIMVMGISFRFTRLDSVPREMTSDHVEKIQDAYRVSRGEYRIFFPNNGGREPVQMYLLSILSNWPGLGFNFYTLKFLAVVESVLTLPLLFWMGLELLGDNRARFNKAVALLLMALVAASYWHVINSRQGLRIPLTPAVTAVALIYLARGMRCNRRSDYVKAALALGFGLYMYQAVRMLPVVIVIGVMFAMWMRGAGWREKLRYLFHLGILVFVSLMVFLPMLHFWLEFPSSFWMRTSTRILGDHLAFATVADAIEALRANIPVLMHNIRNALLMYNWKGDIGWFNGASEHPVMDTLTGAFLILGSAAWLAKTVKSRDPVHWFMPVVVLVMLMPSALSLAHPDANPSNSRALGTLPVVYMFAALALGMMGVRLQELVNGRKGRAAAIIFAVGVVLVANHLNSETYFDRYATAYLGPAFPHSEAGRIVHGFATSDGAIGNAWSVGYPYWWDYRALGIEAGYPMWPNDMHPMENLPRILQNALQRRGTYRLDPNKDLLFLFNPVDEGARQRLGEWFPNGRATIVQSYQPEDSFVLYRVPALGETGWKAFFAHFRRNNG